jgi:hypothetical protein
VKLLQGSSVKTKLTFGLFNFYDLNHDAVVIVADLNC